MTQLPQNHHHHDHPGGTDPASRQPLDPAQQSLSEALRMSFGILKVAMVILAAIFVFSGFFQVNQKQAAIVLRFGVPVGGLDTPTVYEPGLHWALPYPIDTKVTIPLAKDSLLVEDFFFYIADKDKAKPIEDITRSGGLSPGVDGMLLTADMNIIHANWFVEYRIDDPVAFIRNVAVSLVGREQQFIENADEVIRPVVQAACVRVVAGFRADDILFGAEVDEVQRRVRVEAQESLDRLKSGIVIDQLLIRHPAPPPQVRRAFMDVLNADQEKQKDMEEAFKEAETTLNETAGTAYEQLIPAIEAYEAARQNGDDAETVQQLRDQIDTLLLNEAGGEAASRILDARSYYSETVQSIQSTAKKFEELLPEYRRNPAIVLMQLWADTKRQVLGGDVEKMYVPDGAKEIRIQVGRNPEAFRRRERERYQTEVVR